MADLHDFGEKIGGARKDLWAARGLVLSDLDEMTTGERKTHIKKDNIWPRPNWEENIMQGTPQAVAYWQNKMRASIPPRPPLDTQDAQNNYVEVVSVLRDAIMAVKEPHEIDSFYRNFLQETYVRRRSHGHYVDIVPEAEGIVTNKVLKAAQSSHRSMQREAEEKLFGVPKEEQTYVKVRQSMSVHLYDGAQVTLEPDRYSSSTRNALTIASTFGRSFYYLESGSEFYNPDKWQEGTYFVMDDNKRQPAKINFESKEEALSYVESLARAAQERANGQEAGKGKASGKKRKGHFVPPQLKHVKRTGPSYRGIRPANASMFLDDLKFRGGEYGNWLSHEDRQASLNMAYDALRDLARILDIQPEDVSLNGSLAIAFGARGRGGAGAGAAHYEPDRQVINLTKMSGAGCLAHEWGHALDHAIGLACNASGPASEHKSPYALPKSFLDVLTALKYKTITVPAGELSAEQAEAAEKSEQKLSRWLAYVKPSTLSEEDTRRWNAAAKAITEGVDTFTGLEYFRFRRADTLITKPEIELLSQIRKKAIGRGISADDKRAIVSCVSEIKRHREQAKSQQGTQRRVKTDFLKASIAFDAAFSRAGHGYWQSDCEMFARAFDCYIADKFKAEGEQSQYLTAHSDSFSIPGTDGAMIHAFPTGEERAVINEKFDRLIEDIKERGILHHQVEAPEISPGEPEAGIQPPKPPLNAKPIHYEQMSLDDIIFAAASQKEQSKPLNDRTQSDLIR